MKRNKSSKGTKWLVIGSSILGGAIVVALILVAALMENKAAANIVSIIASILSAVLSIVAIIYTFHSNIQTDTKLKQILEMGKNMQKIETEIKEVRDSNTGEQTPELQEKLKQYEKDLELVDQFFK